LHVSETKSTLVWDGKSTPKLNSRHHHLIIYKFQNLLVQQKILPVAQFRLLNTIDDTASFSIISLEALPTA
jgi:hypothetical protein